MPEPKKPEKKPDEKIEIIPSEPKPQQGEVKEIVLDAITGKPVELAPQSVSAEEFRKFQARMEFQERQREKRDRDLQEAIQRLNQPQPARPAEKPEPQEDFDPELDAIAKVNYQKYTRLQARKEAEQVAEEKFKKLMEEEKKQREQESLKQSTLSQLEKQKAWVLEKVPALGDENSEEFRAYYQTYNRMLSEDPSLTSNPYAPKLVYNEWRENVKAPEQNQEAERLKRVAAGNVPLSRGVSESKTIKLTQEEVDMCKRKNLSPAAYAEAKQANLKEGLSA